MNLGRALIEDSHKVKLLTFNVGGKLPAREIIDGVKITRAPYSYSNIAGKLFTILLIIPYFLKQVITCDSVIIFGPMQGFMAFILVSKLLRRKVVYRPTMLGADDAKALIKKFPLFRHFRKFILDLADVHFALNPEIARRYETVYGKTGKLFQSPQGVNTNLFYPVDDKRKKALREKLNLPLDKPVLLSVGYVIERKGYRKIFESLDAIEQDHLFVVIGDHDVAEGHYMYGKQEEMQQLVHAGQDLLGNKVKFMGAIDNVSEYYQAADIFLINSVNEGVPNVILEAMACGCAVFTRSIPGVDGYITLDGENALVVKEDELTTHLQSLMAQPALREQLGHNGSAFIHQAYSIRNVGRMLMVRVWG